MKKSVRYLTATAVFGLLAAAGIASLGITPTTLFADGWGERGERGEWGEREEHDRRQWGHRRQDVLPVRNAQYAEECGSCHFAYPAGLLPSNSWQALMQGLDDHFGDNAGLDADTARSIESYLLANAADASGYGRSKGFAYGNDKPVLRITDTRYFRRKHDEVPGRLVKGNPDVGSFSNCQACHRGADKGNFDEHQVRIPGVGRWDD